MVKFDDRTAASPDIAVGSADGCRGAADCGGCAVGIATACTDEVRLIDAQANAEPAVIGSHRYVNEGQGGVDVDDKPLKPGGKRGGRRPVIDEEALRLRYGKAGLDFVVLLYSLAREGKFTTLDAAQHWAATQPDDAREHKIVKATGAEKGAIDRRRLSEAMKMDKGPIPVGLVKAFLELWTRQQNDDSDRIDEIATELTQLRRLVVSADHHAKTSGSASASKPGTLTRAAEVSQLKDRLLQVQENLIQTQKSEARFRDLCSFMFVALTRLQSTHQQLSRERDELLARAEAAEAAEWAARDAQIAGEQLARAEHQLEKARSRATEAEGLVWELQTRYMALRFQLQELEASTEFLPPFSAAAIVGSEELPKDGSLRRNEEILDRVDGILTEGNYDLTETRRRLAHNGEPDAQWSNNELYEAWAESGGNVPSVVQFASSMDTPLNMILAATEQDDPSPASPASATQASWARLERVPESSTSASPVRQPAKTGWRNAVRLLSGGLFSPKESFAIHQRELIARINQPLDRCYKVAVLSLKGGVGKTTVAASLGLTFSALRDDRVIAIDADPDRGTLVLKVPRETTATVRHLLRDLSRITSYEDVRAYTSQDPSGLEILASERDLSISEAFSERDYLNAIAIFELYYKIVLTDCGTGLMRSAMKGVLDQADSLVLVSSGSVDGAQTSAATLDWLNANGYRSLVTKSVAVINAVRPGSGRIDLDRLAAHFASHCRAVVRIPFDPHLELGIEIELSELGEQTRMALMELASSIAEDFPPQGPDTVSE